MGDRRTWEVVGTLAMAYFLTQLDVAILAVAVPDVVAALRASTEQVVWALTSYTLPLAVALLAAGRLGDRYGHRRVFLIGVAVFTVSSLAGGAVQNAAELIAARTAQGLGAALLAPQTLALIVTVLPPERRGPALGVRGAVGGVAAVCGPVVGGALIGGLDWRWIFYANVPIGLAVLVVGHLVLPEGAPPRRHPLDATGIALACTTLAGLAFFVSQGDRYGWNAGVWTVLLASGVCAVAFVAQQRRRQGREPLLPFALLRIRNLALTSVYAITTAGTVTGIVIALSVFLQSQWGLDPVQTGLMIAVASVMSVLFDPIAGFLLRRVAGKHLLAAGSVLTVAGLVWTAAKMRATADWPTLISPIAVIGVGNAFLFTPMAAVALDQVDKESAGGAAGVLTTALQIGSLIGAATTGAIVGGSGDVRTAMLALAGIAAAGGLVSLLVRPARNPAGPIGPRPVASSPEPFPSAAGNDTLITSGKQKERRIP